MQTARWLANDHPKKIRTVIDFPAKKIWTVIVDSPKDDTDRNRWIAIHDPPMKIRTVIDDSSKENIDRYQ